MKTLNFTMCIIFGVLALACLVVGFIKLNFPLIAFGLILEVLSWAAWMDYKDYI